VTGPDQVNLPFFAYGVFRKGELGFLSISDLVSGVVEPCFVRGSLLLRDGLPIMDPTGHSDVPGSLISFREGLEKEAYGRINRLEPDRQYRWQETNAQGVRCNYLVGRSPRKGSVPADEGWNGRNDPLFTTALEVVRETLEAEADFEWDLKPMFRLQMAYLLLWSSIERYASLRYHLGDRAADKVMQIADDPKFGQLLKRMVTRTHRIQRADRPQDHYELTPGDAKKSLNYYYQIRSNITHRGKGVVRDHEIVRDSLKELLEIFSELLRGAFESSSREAPNQSLEPTAGRRTERLKDEL
jgi:hypothetical protein